jgi:APA family basic amino acid/polyamine antiporter
MTETVTNQDKSTGFVRALGLLDCTMMVAGSMIGSGIFLVSADIARQVGAPGWLLVVWLVTGILTIAAALSFGELAAMMPHAGGQYVYLREAYSPLCAFLYGWTFFLVIQAGGIAAVSIAFARYFGVLWPAIDESAYLLGPVRLGTSGYAISLSTAQLVGVLMILVLTWVNTRGIHLGKLVQNSFTLTKTAALLGLIVLGLLVGWNAEAVQANFTDVWTVRGSVQSVDAIGQALTAASAFGLFIGICVAQTNSLFSADGWNYLTFAAGEIRNPRRDIPLSLALGTSLVIALYLLANVAYLVTLPFETIQSVPGDRVASAAAMVIFGSSGAVLMAAAIIISTFGANNGVVLAGARAFYAMARDGLFFRKAGELNDRHVPAWALLLQGTWAAALVLPRTITRYDAAGQPTKYGSLYNDLLVYMISAELIFYILTIAGIVRLRHTRPDAERPYRAWGYPLVPVVYMLGAGIILLALFVFQPKTTWPGLVIVGTGFPVYFLWRALGKPTGGADAR